MNKRKKVLVGLIPVVYVYAIFAVYVYAITATSQLEEDTVKVSLSEVQSLRLKVISQEAELTEARMLASPLGQEYLKAQTAFREHVTKLCQELEIPLEDFRGVEADFSALTVGRSRTDEENP